jgi:cytochrome c biogenesis protein CcmG/thiol:disulfide interchange protein DsbE
MKYAGFILGLALAGHFVYPNHDGPTACVIAPTARLILEKKPAPGFTLKSLDGQTVHLSDFRGKPVLLNFWATWCAPCKVETPWLVDFYKQYHPAGLEIVGVSLDDAGEESRIAEFIKKYSVKYPILVGNDEVAGAYGGVRYLPQTFFIDRKGNIVKSTLGFSNREDLDENIKQLISTY